MGHPCVKSGMPRIVSVMCCPDRSSLDHGSNVESIYLSASDRLQVMQSCGVHEELQHCHRFDNDPQGS
eukprot:1188592-Prorocentrum_minimum.AAC.8